MLARCAQCGVRFVVPDDRAANPNLKVRCRCGVEFALHAPRPTRPAAELVSPTATAPRPADGATLMRSGAWRRCVQHPQAKSESVCPACGVGFCRECEKRVRNVPVCPRCEGLCADAAKIEEDSARERQRARTMRDDIGFVFAYPFTDRAAYIMLALFTWIFSFFQAFAMGVILSKGVLVWYGFTALTKVSVGKFRGFMPNFGDITDIVHPLRLSAAAILIASGPLLALPFVVGPPDLPAFLEAARRPPELVYAQEAEPAPVDEDLAAIVDEEAGAPADAAATTPQEEPFEAADSGTPLWVGGLYVLAFLWQLFYMPMALIVAAISRGFFKTLNPIIGVEAIAKMGGAYWFAALLYSLLTLVQALLEGVLSAIPIAGSLVASFTAAYVSLTTGCALGLAVFKRARELDLD